MAEAIEEVKLPSTFEEFNEQRKAAFIRVKDYKQAGNRLIGYLCSYTPLEIIDAAGAASVALCGTSDEVIARPRRCCRQTSARSSSRPTALPTRKSARLRTSAT